MQVDVLISLRFVVQFVDKSETFPHFIILLGAQPAGARTSGPIGAGTGRSGRQWRRSSGARKRPLGVRTDILGSRGRGSWSFYGDIGSPVGGTSNSLLAR